MELFNNHVWLMPILICVALAVIRSLTTKDCLNNGSGSFEFITETYVYLGILSLILIIVYNMAGKKQKILSNRFVWQKLLVAGISLVIGIGFVYAMKLADKKG